MKPGLCMLEKYLSDCLCEGQRGEGSVWEKQKKLCVTPAAMKAVVEGAVSNWRDF